MDAFRQIGGIALTLALLAAALWWLRRRGAVNFRGGRGPRVMEVIESRGLAPGFSYTDGVGIHVNVQSNKRSDRLTHGSCLL